MDLLYIGFFFFFFFLGGGGAKLAWVFWGCMGVWMDLFFYIPT